MKKTMLVLVTALLTTALQADVIVSTDFDNRRISGTTVTPSWGTPVLGIESISNLTLGSHNATTLTLMGGNVHDHQLSPNHELRSSKSWSISFSLKLADDYTGTLTGIDFVTDKVKGSGDTQNVIYNRSTNYALTLTDSEGLELYKYTENIDRYETGAQPTHTDLTVDFNTSIDLAAGSEYFFHLNIYADHGSTHYAAIDNSISTVPSASCPRTWKP